MAKENAKKTAKSNEARLKTFKLITALANILYLCLVFGYHRRGQFYWRDLLGLTFWVGQEVFCLRTLENLGKPTFAEDGLTLQSCVNLSNPAELGLLSFVQDMLWVCWVVQVLCGFHVVFCVFYLPMPGIILYKLYCMAKSLFPSMPSRNGADVSEGEPENSAKERDLRRKEAFRRRKGKK